MKDNIWMMTLEDFLDQNSILKPKVKYTIKSKDTWYQEGKQPPVGSEVEACFNGDDHWFAVTIVANIGDGDLVVKSKSSGLKSLAPSYVQYRPSKPKTEKEILLDLIKNNELDDEMLATKILELGFKLK